MITADPKQSTDWGKLEDEHFRISASHLLSTVRNHVHSGHVFGNVMFLREESHKTDYVLEICHHCFFFNKVGKVKNIYIFVLKSEYIDMDLRIKSANKIGISDQFTNFLVVTVCCHSHNLFESLSNQNKKDFLETPRETNMFLQNLRLRFFQLNKNISPENVTIVLLY